MGEKVHFVYEGVFSNTAGNLEGNKKIQRHHSLDLFETNCTDVIERVLDIFLPGLFPSVVSPTPPLSPPPSLFYPGVFPPVFSPCFFPQFVFSIHIIFQTVFHPSWVLTTLDVFPPFYLQQGFLIRKNNSYPLSSCNGGKILGGENA